MTDLAASPVPGPGPGYDLGPDVDRGGMAPVQQQFGSQYVLGEQLGRGAMGRVVRARRLDGGPDVAVKLLRDDIAGDAALVSRFLTEKRVLESLHSPYVVEVLDLVVDGGRIGIVMELVEGGDLRRLMTGPMPEEQVRVVGGRLQTGTRDPKTGAVTSALAAVVALTSLVFFS